MVGTLAWAAQTRGTLRARDRLALQGQIALLVLERLPRPVLRRLGLTRLEPVRADVAKIRPPQTDTAAAATTLCAEASSAAIANHALRTYVWSRLLALRDGLRYDDELLYVAAVLHDLGLTERFWGRPGTACFSVEGGEAARDFALAQGWPAGRADALAEAIVLHLNVTVGRRRGAEAHLVQAGTALDVTGARLRAIAGGTAAEVVELHPRLELKAELAGWFERERSARPDARLAFLDRKVALGRRTAFAPFDG